jgi:hypothetical protein
VRGTAGKLFSPFSFQAPFWRKLVGGFLFLKIKMPNWKPQFLNDTWPTHAADAWIGSLTVPPSQTAQAAPQGMVILDDLVPPEPVAPTLKTKKKIVPSNKPPLEINQLAKEANPWQPIQSVQHFKELRAAGYPIQYWFPYPNGVDVDKMDYRPWDYISDAKIAAHTAEQQFYYNKKERVYSYRWFICEKEGIQSLICLVTSNFDKMEEMKAEANVKKALSAGWGYLRMDRNINFEGFLCG